MSATHFDNQPAKIGRFNPGEPAGASYGHATRTLFLEPGCASIPDLIDPTTTEGGTFAVQSVEFANVCEEKFARMLESNRILWRYKPRTFAVEWDEEGNFLDCFTPGFYLPAEDRYFELASPDCLVSGTAKKVRLLRQQYSRVKIDLIVWRGLSMEMD